MRVGGTAAGLAAMGAALSALAALQHLQATQQKTVGISDCSFHVNPDRFLNQQSRIRREVFDRTAKFTPALARVAPVRPKASAEIPRKNFIDTQIFSELERHGVPPAGLSTDEEFLRRVTLDLTGRIPSADDIRAFLADPSATKREDIIDKLLYSEEATYYWTWWVGEWLQNTATSASIARQRQIKGRDAFFNWIRDAVFSEKSFKDLAYEVVIAIGNNYNDATGAANFAVGSSTAMGPIQDTYDTMFAKTASTFLGLAHYDCLLCHNGRGHLDQISLWGSNTTRVEAERNAAFFSRMRLVADPTPAPKPGEMPASPYYQSTNVVNVTTGGYDLNTTYGNRPNRVPIGSVRTLSPQYRSSGDEIPLGAADNWRDIFAQNMVQDPMFARNIVNRLWKHMFNLGLVDPVDTMDPARLDPSNPPPAPWTFQATHPQLLEQLAAAFVEMNYQLRPFLRLLARSSAYQLSSRYQGEWKIEYVPLFARHYPRRMEGEEVHDAIAKATGVLGSYSGSWGGKIEWATYLPEPAEPRGNEGNARVFMDAFYRGNRDQLQRSQSGSILQQLYLMNDGFVTTRVKVAASPKLKAIAALNSDAAAVDELFLTFLSRHPTDYERDQALAFLSKAGTPAARNNALEDLAWVCINKQDFLFSY